MLPLATADAEVARAVEQQLEETAEVPVIIVMSEEAELILDPIQGEITHEYTTIDAVAATLTAQGLEELKENPHVEQIVLDGQRNINLATSVPLIHAAEAHLIKRAGINLTGQGQTICIIDTGIDTTHEAFAGRILPGYDFVNNDDDPTDDNGHGTHVAGIAVGNAGVVRGVAPGAFVVPVKVCGSGGSCSDSAILAGIDFCNNKSIEYNITIISGSLGGGGPYTEDTCSFDPSFVAFEALFARSAELGIIPVFSAGNSYFDDGLSYPACSPQVISVGSSNRNDEISDFSNEGDTLDIYAPGDTIISSYPQNSLANLWGTSMAAPHVSGTLAVLKQQHLAMGKQLDLASAIILLRTTGKPLGTTSRIDLHKAIIYSEQQYLFDRDTFTLTNSSASLAFTTPIQVTETQCIRLQDDIISIDTDACPQYNITARLTLPASEFSAPLHNGEPCSSCRNITYNNGALSFDVVEFSEYTITSCPLTLFENTVLNEDIVINSSCINIADNVILDCQDHSIIFENNNGGSGISIIGRENVTIQSCNLVSDTDTPLVAHNSNNIVFEDVTIDTNGVGIELLSSNITGNNISLNASTWISAIEKNTILFRTEFGTILTSISNITITQDIVNISYNKADLLINNSAQITLFDLPFNHPVIVEGSALCEPPRCVEQSITPSFTFNVTEAGSYSTIEGSLLNIKFLTPATAVRGRQNNYTIIIENNGTFPATNISIDISCLINASSSHTNNNTLFIETVEEQSTEIIDIVALAPSLPNGTQTNTIITLYYMVGQEVLQAQAVNSTTILGLPELIVNATSSREENNVTFVITLSNRGDEVAYNTTLELSHNGAFINASLPSDNNQTFSFGDIAPDNSQSLIVKFDAGTININISLNYTGQEEIFAILATAMSEPPTPIAPVTPTTTSSGGRGGGGGGGGAFIAPRQTAQLETEEPEESPIPDGDRQIERTIVQEPVAAETTPTFKEIEDNTAAPPVTGLVIADVSPPRQWEYLLLTFVCIGAALYWVTKVWKR